MVLATRIIRNAAAEAGKSAAAKGAHKPMSANSELYHVAPTGFWKKFRDAVVVNPEISSGLPIPEMNRYPQPGSRTEKYATPATKASDVAFNPYWKRDTRRAYPQTTYIDQTELSGLLLSSPSLASLPAPPVEGTKTPANSSSITPMDPSAAQTGVVNADAVPALSDVLAKLPAGQAFVGGGVTTGQGSSSGLPPTPPRIGAKWVPRAGDEIPSAPNSYFPMIGYK